MVATVLALAKVVRQYYATAGTVSVSPMLSFNETDGLVAVCVIMLLSEGTMTENPITVALATSPGQVSTCIDPVF